MAHTVEDPSIYAEMRRYVRLGEQDVEALRALRDHAAPHFERIAGEFYDRIREHEEAHAVFTSEAQIGRLKRSLVVWLDRVLMGPYDEQYVLQSANIGRIHVKVGLPQRYMFTAMALIRVALLDLAGGLGSSAQRARSAIARVLDLELAIMMETYRDDFVARIQRADRLEREEIGRSLAVVEHRYKNAIDLARVLIVGLDADGVIRLFNREAERVTGHAPEEMLGQSFVTSLLPEDLRAEQAELFSGAALEAERRPVLESAVSTKSGARRSVRWQLALGAQDGDDVHVLAVGQDVTDAEELAARVRRSEKLAAVGTLAAGLAHEIRNPLNGAHLHMTFLERGMRKANVMDPEALDAVRVVREEISRLATLVTEFLEFARPKPPERRTSGVVGLCERASSLVAGYAAAASVRLTLDLPEVDALVSVDPDKISQVLINLLRNGVDAMTPLGSGNLVLRARKQPRWVLLEVEDEGPGVSDPAAPIFDPFFSTKPSGTGLGLAIVHRIVSDHDGSVDFESRPGKTVFRVRLPRVPEAT